MKITLQIVLPLLVLVPALAAAQYGDPRRATTDASVVSSPADALPYRGRVDDVNLGERSLVIDDQTFTLDPNVRVYSGDFRTALPRQIRKGQGVKFSARGTSRPVITGIWIMPPSEYRKLERREAREE